MKRLLIKNFIYDKNKEYDKNEEYDKIIKSEDFINKLNIINFNLKKSLENEGYQPILIGNLFYDHEQKEFYNSKELDINCYEKRKRFVKAAKESNVMFEIGTNGGHSSFLALISNENLKVYSNDIAKFYPPCPNIHPEIYVNVAVETLKNMFNDRFTFIKGDCLIEVPIFVKNNLNLKIDLVHIDGHKDTYKQDFINLLPILANNCIVIFDDTQQKGVQNQVNELIKENYLHKTSDFHQMNDNIKYRHEILIYKKY